MIRALFSGSFDPLTIGHADVIERAATIFDEVYVCAFANSEKDGFFTLPERFEIIRAYTDSLPNVHADYSSGAVADYVRDKGINVIIKGVRSPLDCQYEIEVADVNRRLSGAETVMLACHAGFSRINSTIVREMLRIGKPISDYVPTVCEKKIAEIMAKRR